MVDFRKLKISKARSLRGHRMYKVQGLFFMKKSDAIAHQRAVIKLEKQERLHMRRRRKK